MSDRANWNQSRNFPLVDTETSAPFLFACRAPGCRIRASPNHGAEQRP